MRPLTETMPKPMLPVAGKPMLEWTIEALKELGVDEITILIGWRSKPIRDHFGNGSDKGVKIKYLHQEEQLGTAHAVGVAKKAFSEPFFCLSGDVVVTKDGLNNLIAVYEKKGASVMGLAEVENPSRYGVVRTEGHEVVEIKEKPGDTDVKTINAGTYLFTPSIFHFIEKTDLSPRGEYELTDSLELMAQKDGLPFALLEDEWHDAARPWDLLDINKWLLSRLPQRFDGKIEAGATIKGKLIAEEGSLIKSGSYLEGDVFIGKNATVGPNGYLRGSTMLDANCKLGASSEVKNSIIMKNTNIPHHNYVGDSIIGPDCNLGSGTKVANLRLDEKEIYVNDGRERVATGRRKLGVIMGSGVKTGINAAIDCGTMVGDNTFIGPGCTASGRIAKNSKIL